MTQPDPAAGIRETARILQTAAREHHARREAIRTALTTAPRAGSLDQPTGVHGSGHIYDIRCALCVSDVDTLTDALLGVVHGWEQQEPTDSEVRRQLADTVDALGSAETELRALRTDREQQRQRADKAEEFSRWALAQRQEMAEERYAWQERGDRAEARVADYERRLTWHTTCATCARLLASGIRETERAERAERALIRVRDACTQLHRSAVLADGQPHTDRERGIVQAVNRVRDALNPTPPTAATQATHPTSTDPKETPA